MEDVAEFLSALERMGPINDENRARMIARTRQHSECIALSLQIIQQVELRRYLEGLRILHPMCEKMKDPHQLMFLDGKDLVDSIVNIDKMVSRSREFLQLSVGPKIPPAALLSGFDDTSVEDSEAVRVFRKMSPEKRERVRRMLRAAFEVKDAPK